MMRPFEYRRPGSVAEALGAGKRPDALFIAGGTEVLNWLKDGIEAPATLVDLASLGLDGVRSDGEVLRIGSTTTLAAIAADPLVRSEVPALAAAIMASASPQIRFMGTLGGNLLQRTRCPYFRMAAPLGLPCQLRGEGTGCSARTGDQRDAALLGETSSCLATHPSDPAVALAAVDARVALIGPDGARAIGLLELYRTGPGRTGLGPGELIAEVEIPITPASRSSRFLKVRDRASFDFALVSGAVALDQGRVRLALGGLSWGPWRCSTAEARLGAGPYESGGIREAMAAELEAARPLPGNRFKIELATRVAVALLADDVD